MKSSRTRTPPNSPLVHHLKQDMTGQYFVTTHSPVVLRELTVDDLHIVHSNNGKTEIIAANKPAIADSIQGNFRTGCRGLPRAQNHRLRRSYRGWISPRD